MSCRSPEPATSGGPQVLVGRPADLVELRTQLHSAWDRDPHAAADFCLGQMERTPENLSYAGQVRDWILATLEDAELWWVDPDMSTVIEAAAPSMPDVHPAPPSDSGFVVFASPVRGTDADLADEITTTAYLWGYAERDGADTLIFAAFAATTAILAANGDPPGTVLTSNGRAITTSLCFTGWSSWPTGELTSEVADAANDLVRQSYIEDRRAMAAVWGLVASPGVVSEPEPVARQTRRRAQRAGLDVPADGVRVVRLHVEDRQAEARDGIEGPVPWSHRWVVSGHWRRQWYPSRGQHLAKYIFPHVKGPADKPLVVKDTVRAILP